jgi:hypothetical protein
MKYIKYLALLALSAAVIGGLDACAAKATTSSSGVSASTTTTAK